MKLYRYLARLQSTIYSRREIEVERLITHLTTAFNGRIWGRLRFYRYHYQRADGTLVVRYDNAPHHPDLLGFPNHKHTPTGTEPAEPPDLSEVLKEIDKHVYPTESEM
jgi:hypothetical protein